MLKVLKSVTAILVFALLIFTPLVFAHSATAESYEDIEEATLAHNSPFYFLRTWQESIERFIANFQGDEAIANLEIKHAQRRVAEMKRLARLGRDELLAEAADRWQNHLQRAQERAEQVQERREEIHQKILESMDRHRSTLERVRDQVPDQAKDAIDRAIDNYQTRRESLLEKFSTDRRDDVETHLRQRLNTTVDELQLNRDRFQEILENKSD